MFGKMMNSFYYGKSGKGDFRKEDLPQNRWQLFGEMLRIRLAALSRLNLMTVAAWLPLMVLTVISFSRLLNVSVIYNDYMEYQQSGNLGSLTEEVIAQLSAQYGTGGEGLLRDAFSGILFSFCLWVIPCILITGPVKAGIAYVTRNWARDEHAFIWSDFKDAVKENWKQALGISAITSVVPLVVYVAYRFYSQQAQVSPLFLVPQMLVVMVGVLWALACMYFYPLLVTYRLTFGHVLKNGLLLTVARLPHTLGIRLALLLPGALALAVYMLTGSLIAWLVLGAYYVLIGFALSRFITASFTNGVFDRYINAHMEGVPVNRGLAEPEEDEDDLPDDLQ